MLYKMLTLEEAGWKVHRNSSCYLLPLFCKSELCQTINKRKKIAGSLGLSGKKANSILLSQFATSLSCIGEGNGNPLQCSCLENPRDGEAWWAAVYGITQSQTWLMRFISSSSMIPYWVQLTCYSSSQNSGKHICKFQMKRYIEWGQRWSWALFSWSWGVSPSWCGWTPYYWDILEASSHKHDQLLTLIPSPLPSLGDKDWGWKSQVSDYDLILLVTSPHPGATQSCCIGTKAASGALLTHLEIYKDFPGGAVVNNQLADAGDAGLIPGSGRSPGVGSGNPLQYSCLGNPMDREAWWATVQWVSKELDMT